ncbi:MAG: S8 family serine peptidase [Bacteroidia bacterium]|nr:S8 family serine peptidase [Bacteroidia bacterium]
MTGYCPAQILYDPDKLSPILADHLTLRDTALTIGIILESPQQHPAYRHTGTPGDLIEALRDQASAQPTILRWLESLPGVVPGSIRPLWIVNAIFLRADPETVAGLSHHPAIRRVVWDAPVFPDETDDAAMLLPPVPNGREPGHTLIQAPALWRRGYTGYGRKVLVIDSGIDAQHPALSRQYLGSRGWYDGLQGTTQPYACDDHGTHVLGIILGLDPATRDTIGVAPRAQWMAAPAICDALSSDNLAAFQWALDPDGDPATDDMPDVINNSWRTGDIPDECTDLLYGPALTALEAAGIAVVFSAGNTGPDSFSISPPKNINLDLVNTFTVAAINGNDPSLNLLGFSSRGPSTCGGTGSLLIKPEVSAPGFQIRSARLNGTYGRKSGTSMAAAYVSGALLLLKEAFPYLPGHTLKMALYMTCTDLGIPGEDNEYGQGLIQIEAAYQYLIAQGYVPARVPVDPDITLTSLAGLTDLTCATSVFPAATVRNQGNTPVTDLTFYTDLPTGETDTLHWNGLLLPDDSATVPLGVYFLPPGTATLRTRVSLPETAGEYRLLDNTITWTGFRWAPSALQVQGDTVCPGQDGLLTAYGAPGPSIRWTADAAGTETLGYGHALFMPAVTLPDTCWVTADGYQTLPAPAQAAWSADSGAAFVVQVYMAATLVSATVNAQAGGTLLLSLRRANGTLVWRDTFYLPAGPSRIVIEKPLLPGHDYRLEMISTTPLQEYQQPYPVMVPGVLAVTGTNRGPARWFYLGDWEIRTANPCERQPVYLEVRPGQMETHLDADPSLFVPGEINCTDLSTGATRWRWDFGDGSSASVQHPAHRYVTQGAYRLSLAAVGPDGCSDADTLLVKVTADLTTGLSPEDRPSSIHIYPNPASDGVWLSSTSPLKRVYVTWADLNGRLLGTTPVPLLSAEHFIPFPGPGSGIYVLMVQAEGQLLARRLIFRP